MCGEMKAAEEFTGGVGVGDGLEGRPGEGVAVEVIAGGDRLQFATPVDVGVGEFDCGAVVAVAEDVRDGERVCGEMGEEAVFFFEVLRCADECGVTLEKDGA